MNWEKHTTPISIDQGFLCRIGGWSDELRHFPRGTGLTKFNDADVAGSIGVDSAEPLP